MNPPGYIHGLSSTIWFRDCKLTGCQTTEANEEVEQRGQVSVSLHFFFKVTFSKLEVRAGLGLSGTSPVPNLNVLIRKKKMSKWVFMKTL